MPIAISSNVDLEMKCRVSLISRLAESLNFQQEDWQANKQKLFNQISFSQQSFENRGRAILPLTFQQVLQKPQMVRLQYTLTPEDKHPQTFPVLLEEDVDRSFLLFGNLLPPSENEAIHLSKLSLSLYQCLRRSKGNIIS